MIAVQPLKPPGLFGTDILPTGLLLSDILIPEVLTPRTLTSEFLPAGRVLRSAMRALRVKAGRTGPAISRGVSQFRFQDTFLMPFIQDCPLYSGARSSGTVGTPDFENYSQKSLAPLPLRFNRCVGR